MKKITKATLLTTALLMTSNAMAYSLIIENQTEVAQIPYVSSLGSGLAPDSVNGWLQPGHERIYDLRSSWLTSGAMNVQNGDKRRVSIGDVDCGEVTFEGVQKLTLQEGSDGMMCSVTPVAQVTESMSYSTSNPNYTVGYTIEDFNNGDDKDQPELYANGPHSLKWGSGRSYGSQVTIYALNEETLEEQPIVLEMWRVSGACQRDEMNNAVKCGGNPMSHYHAAFRSSWNPDLPKGLYTGIAKIKATDWHDHVDPYTFDLGVVINNK